MFVLNRKQLHTFSVELEELSYVSSLHQIFSLCQKLKHNEIDKKQVANQVTIK